MQDSRQAQSITGNPNVVVGLFHHRDKAEAALSDLQTAGFTTADIGVAARTEGEEWAEYHNLANDPASNAGSGAAAGAAAGAGVGGLWALGIAAGMLPAIGPAIAGGILASLVASAAAGAAAGGVLGGLIGLGMPEADAQYYEEEFKRGRILVTVRTATRAAEARQIMRAHGAYDVEQREDRASMPTSGPTSTLGSTTPRI